MFTPKNQQLLSRSDIPVNFTTALHCTAKYVGSPALDSLEVC